MRRTAWASVYAPWLQLRSATICACPKSPKAPVPDANPRPKPVVLLILDGWGHRDDPTDNALAQADLPNWRRLLAAARTP